MLLGKKETGTLEFVIGSQKSVLIVRGTCGRFRPIALFPNTIYLDK